MLWFDLRPSLAGRQIYQMGKRHGAIKIAREIVLQMLTERFGVVPKELRHQLRMVKEQDLLKTLLNQALRCSNLESFREMLAKTD